MSSHKKLMNLKLPAVLFWIMAVIGLVLREWKLNWHIGELADKEDAESNRGLLTAAQILYGVGVLGCLGVLVSRCVMSTHR